MPTRIKTRTAATEQERQQLLSAAAALRTAAPSTPPSWPRSSPSATPSPPEHQTKIYKEATAHVYLRHQEKPLWR